MNLTAVTVGRKDKASQGTLWTGTAGRGWRVGGVDAAARDDSLLRRWTLLRAHRELAEWRYFTQEGLLSLWSHFPDEQLRPRG